MPFSSNRRILIGLFAFFCVSGIFANAKAQSDPPVGETIDLLSFRSRSGQTLAEAVKKNSLAMLVLVDPNCGTCTSTKENMDALRAVVEKTRIAYFIVMIPDGSDTQKYFDYADSLKLGAESFVWSNADAKPAALLIMTKPSHLQITSDGLIVAKWTGTPAKDAP
jgi:hypothetical protein